MAKNSKSMGNARNSDDMARSNSDSGDTGREVGEGVGGVGGAVAGAAIGSMAGPIGTVIGGIAGAVGGWWAGREVAGAVEGSSTDDTYYRSNFDAQPRNAGTRFTSYDQARPIYQLGYIASRNPDYSGRSFDEIDTDLRRGWSPEMERQYGKWSDVRGYAQQAYDRGCQMRGNQGAMRDQNAMRDQGEQKLTRAEEELVVGKRQVKAGEVDLKKTVETEHVQKKVPLMHEEIEVERHAVNANASSGDAHIGERDIRIPLTAEEAVVEKRVVAKEEVVVSKHAVQGSKEVEADLRKERIDIDKQGHANINDRSSTSGDDASRR